MAPSREFAFRYGMFRSVLSVVGCGPRFSHVIVTGDRLRVRMGWAFSADVPLTAVAAAREDSGLVGGIGVHGWRGRWLVNGAGSGLVAIDIEPPGRARVCGMPVRLRQLRVSIEQPAALVAALSGGG